jgi:multiple sugar transport system permease protein
MPKIRTGRLLAAALVWSYALLLALPIYFLVISSFKDNTSIFNEPFQPPTRISFDNFVAAWENAALGPALINSLLVTIGAEILVLALALPAAYGIGRGTRGGGGGMG